MSHDGYHPLPSHIQPIAPPTALLGLREYNVNWPSFFARALVRALFAAPIVYYVGKASGPRAIVAGVAVGATMTGMELAFDAAGILTLSSGARSPGVIQSGDPNATAQVIDVNGNVVSG